MYALKVQVNDENPFVAGAADLGVLNAIINCVGPLGEAALEVREGEQTNLFLMVGGLTSRPKEVPDEHLRWASNRNLHVGDIVSVKIVEVDSADAPENACEAEKRIRDERAYYEHCKKVYIELREKYEV